MSHAIEKITLDELIRLGIEAHMAEVHVAMPAVVRAYDRAAGTVSVSLPVNAMVPDGSGNYVSDPYPALDDVPIEWPRCGKFSITFPLEAGDTGMLVCCERAIGAWRTTGKPGDCGDVGMHTLDGAVFRPGLSPDGTPPSTASATDMVLGSTTDAKGRVVCKPAAGALGQGSTKGIARNGDSVSLGNCSVTTAVVAGVTVVTAVTINGTALAVSPSVNNPGASITGHSTSWTCED